MRLSELLVHTLREAPAEAEIPSHQLMLRAGLIRQNAAGIYTWLPLGLKVLNKVTHIVREEMQRIGAIELLMPMVQPAELWRESGRWNQYGPELLRLQDRRGREFCLGPTHEEVITDLIRNTVSSHRQLPLTLFQIQTKFRDEQRPRFGIMRAREFLMKDAYSFHLDAESLDETYLRMYTAYARVLERIGLDYRAVKADTGAIGGDVSHEFHVLAESGEDTIVYAPGGGYAANRELAEARPSRKHRPAAEASLARVATPHAYSIADVSKLLGIPPSQCIKTLLVKGSETPAVALILRGDDELNPVKASHLSEVASPLKLLGEEDVHKLGSLEFGSIGPVDLEFPVIADREASLLADFCCGANTPGEHLTGVNWGHDLPEPAVVDIRLVKEGDRNPEGSGRLSFARGIEVGHVFKLGKRYSTKMGAVVQDRHGAERPLMMGCYGLGISRIVAAAIEQNHDARGILWPAGIAPFLIIIVPLGAQHSADIRGAAERLHNELHQAGFEVVLDDRCLRAGVMLKDSELLGIPHRLVLSARSREQNVVEYRARSAASSEDLPRDGLIDALRERLTPQ